MKLIEFEKTENIIQRLLTALEIISQEKAVIRIDHNPDYDISKYQREIVSNYFFHNSWDFTDTFNSIINIDILETHILDDGAIESICNQCGIKYNANPTNYDFLINAFLKSPELFEEFGFGTGVGDFELQNLRIRAINNIAKSVYYEGSFQGDSIDIDPIDWGIYSFLNVLAISAQIDSLPFYKTVLAESYLLLREENFKLSYFVAFSAFESFINYEANSFDESERLKDKLKNLFRKKHRLPDTDQIYTSVINFFDGYIIHRNNIAHGSSIIQVEKLQAEKVILHILILVSSFKFGVSTFDDLITRV